MKRKGISKISNKIILTYSILFIFVITSFSYFYYNQSKKAQISDLHAHLIDLMNFSLPLIDGDYLTLFNEKGDGYNEYYRNISENLFLVKNSSSKIKDIFIVHSSIEDSYIYTISMPNDDRLGIEFEINQETKNELNKLNTQPFSERKYTTYDPSTHQMMGYSPIYNKFGEIQGYLVIIFNAESIQLTQRNILLFLVISILTFLPVFIALNILFARKITMPIEALLKATKRVEQGIFSKKVNIKSNDEFQILGNTFNTMMSQIKSFLDSLQNELNILAKTHKMQASTYKISQATLTTQNLDELYKQIHKILSEAMNVENFYIALYYKTTNQVDFVFFENKFEEFPPLRLLENNLTDLIIKTGNSYYLSHDQIKEMQDSNKVFPLETIPLDFIGYPLKINEQVIGVIATQRYLGEKEFTQEDKEFFEFVSNQIALSIDRKRAESIIAQSNNRYSKLFNESPTPYLEIDFSKLSPLFEQKNITNKYDLQNEYNTAEFYEECLNKIDIVGVNQAYLRLFDIEDEQQFIYNYSIYILRQNMRESISQIIELILDSVKTAEKELILNDKSGKNKILLTRWTLLDYTDEHLPTNRAIISFIDITEQKNYEEKLTYENNHDALTGVYNRAFFEKESNKIDIKTNKPISIIIADIDRLKTINDNRGHIYGDQAIKNTAKILEQSFREEDKISRIGGDEFVILLSNTNEESVQTALNRINENVNKHNQEHNDTLELSLGYSTGYENKTIEEIFEEADMNMYKNKNSRKK